eukprot:CAMPEP_0118683138 /NCGR_PEP_ID=MMETSP0800-20121206/5870_1 /TAXON_ID=210618 ORGANISM="Striatella unipunctata, Strain CCMP2910" /NCGR_SAMPLE_ID=MMETSP0800 /ASSEMBLY_ACC=CAM_ASM_000638 /LENGTH=152 /DNA_ID=CAMNT_0006579597 /DNA_START=60 /DNA_END=515 /DNA_ORIENTATION=-
MLWKKGETQTIECREDCHYNEEKDEEYSKSNSHHGHPSDDTTQQHRSMTDQSSPSWGRVGGSELKKKDTTSREAAKPIPLSCIRPPKITNGMIISGGFTDSDWSTFPVLAINITDTIYTNKAQWLDLTPSDATHQESCANVHDQHYNDPHTS